MYINMRKKQAGYSCFKSGTIDEFEKEDNGMILARLKSRDFDIPP